MNKIKTYIKQNIIMIWVIIMTCAMMCLTVMAAYTPLQNKAKKVIAVQAESDMQFSSNYLEESLLFKTVVISDGDPVYVDIRNYSKSNSSKFYPSDISYTLVATLTDSSGEQITDNSLIGSGEVLIKYVYGDNENTIMTLNASTKTDSRSQALVHGTGAAINSYRIYFPSASSRVCVKLSAVPDANHTDLRTISAILAVSDKSNIQGDGWTGSFNDPSNKAPDQYDAFNYVISGHGNSNSAVIKWDTSVITLNKMYISDNFSQNIISDATDVSGRTGWKQITISLDDDTSHGQYAFQVFKTSGFDTWYSGVSGTDAQKWNALKNCIEFDDGI